MQAPESQRSVRARICLPDFLGTEDPSPAKHAGSFVGSDADWCGASLFPLNAEARQMTVPPPAVGRRQHRRQQEPTGRRAGRD